MFGNAGFAEEPELEPVWGKAALESVDPLLGSAGFTEPEALPLREADGKSMSALGAWRARAERSDSRATEGEAALRGNDGVNGEPAVSVALAVLADGFAAAAATALAFGVAVGGAAFNAEPLGAAALSGGATFDGIVVGGASLSAGAGSSRGLLACCSYAKTAAPRTRQAATGVITRQRRNVNGRVICARFVAIRP